MLKVVSLYNYYINKEKKELEQEKQNEENSILNYLINILERNYEIEMNADKEQSDNSMRNFIIIGLAEKNIMLDIKDISEAIKIKQMAKIGYVYDWFLGISNHNGIPYTILDLNFFYNKIKSDIKNSYAIVLNNKYKSNLAILCPNIKKLEKESSLKLKENNIKNKELLSDGIIRTWIDKTGTECFELDITQFLNSIKVADALKINGKV